MTIVLEQKTSEDDLRCVEFEWDKPGTYHVTAVQRYTKDSPNAYLIRRSRDYAYSEHDKAKACYKRYCKRYLEER